MLKEPKCLTTVWGKPIEEASREELIEALQILYESCTLKEQMLQEALDVDLKPHRIMN